MNRLFIGDLHLGSPLFKYFNEVIKLITGDYDEVVIVGDIIDTWEDDINNILKDSKRIITAINNLGQKAVIIKGNHDPSIEVMRAIFPKAQVLDKYINGKLLVIHGEEFDSLVTKFDWLAKIMHPIHWIFQRFGWNIKGWFRELFHSISTKRQKKYYNDLISEVEKSTVRKYGVKYDYIVMGHTHLPKYVTTPMTVYLNCGDWVHNCTYIVSDGETYTLGHYFGKAPETP